MRENARIYENNYIRIREIIKEGIIMKIKNNKKEEKVMKKTLMTLFLVVLSVVLVYGYADAKIVGKACSTCHTMHNSQNGDAVSAGGPYNYLLAGGAAAGKTSCWGCHSSTSTTVNVDATTGAPLVSHNYSVDLAGGNFGYLGGVKSASLVTGDGETAGHNVADAETTDDNFTSNYPPGDSNSNTMTNATFTCAGTLGCHGDRTQSDLYVAVKGSHHMVDDVLKFGSSFDTDQQGSSVGLSYRFLKGVKGAEDANWEGSSPSSTVHNEYMGATTAPTDTSISSPGSAGTISGLCSECHGSFHGTDSIGGDTSSPFTRHPTDIALPTSGEYNNYSTYNITVPIARSSISTGTTSASSGISNAVVMCLSCHRAHASPYADMLRWDYTKMVAGNAATGDRDTGCFACHDAKDGVEN